MKLSKTEKQFTFSRALTSFLFGLLCYVNGYSQHFTPALNVDTFQLQTQFINQSMGLSQGNVKAMVQDNDGYVWFGTKDGLNKFDGKNFIVYRHNPLDSNSISDNHISALHVDKLNRLWIGTVHGGLNLFDQKLNRFIKFKKNNNSNSISSNYVFNLAELPANKIVVICKDDDQFKTQFIEYNEIKTQSPFFGMDSLFTNWDSVITNTSINSLAIYAITTKKHSSVLLLRASIFSDLKPETSISKLYGQTDKNETILIESNKELVKNNYNDGIFFTHEKNELLEFNIDNEEFEVVLRLDSGFSFFSKPQIASNSSILARNDNGKITCFYLSSNKITHYTINDIDVLKVWNRFNKILIDKNNNVFLASAGSGVLKLKATKDRIVDLTNSKAITHRNLRFFTTHSRMLSDANTRKRYTEFETEIGKLNLRPTNTERKYAFLDSDSTIWLNLINTKDYKLGLYGYTTNKRLVNYKLQKSPNKALSEGKHQVTIAKYKNSPWFNPVIDVTPLLENDTNIEFHKHLVIPFKYKAGIYSFVTDWLVDGDSLFWFATLNGVYSYDIKKHHWDRFAITNLDSSESTNQFTFSIALDPIEPNKFIWVGTDGKGLHRIEKATKTAKSIDTDNGLSNNVVYSIIADKRRNLWLSTNNGLCLFNTKTEEIRTFDLSDGLPFLEFNRYQYSQDLDGNLYYEGEGKLIKVIPEKFYDNRSESPVLIDELKIFNQTIEFSKPNKMGYQLPKPIRFCNELVFSKNESMLAFGFTMLDLTSPEDYKYQYKLVGFNNEWIDSGSEQEAIFTNLDPGNYTFMVRGFNSQDVWSRPTELKIKILTPWYKSWWFMSLITITFLGVLYGFYRYRLSQLLQIEKMRNDIAQDLHDEIGSTLSSISLYSAVLQNSAKQLSENSNNLLKKIIDSTSTVMVSMNDMVWSIKSENDTFQKIINRLRAYAVDVTESKEIELIFNVDEKSEQLTLTITERKNIYLIFKEAINNSIKYSSATKLEINIESNKRFLQISMVDNGIGFEYEQNQQSTKSHGGNGLSGMIIRAKQIKSELKIESTLNEGTGVYLKVKNR